MNIFSHFEAIDGKTVRRSFDNVKKSSAIHLVGAWTRENEICIDQKKVDDKSNEITAIPELIEELCINTAKDRTKPYYAGKK